MRCIPINNVELAFGVTGGRTLATRSPLKDKFSVSKFLGVWILTSSSFSLNLDCIASLRRPIPVDSPWTNTYFARRDSAINRTGTAM